MACAIYIILEMFFKLHVVAMTTKYIKTRDESITVTPTNIGGGLPANGHYPKKYRISANWPLAIGRFPTFLSLNSVTRVLSITHERNSCFNL